jgi:PAS domain S-box-containing protein
VIELSRYVFETLRKDGHFTLYRGRRETEPCQILVLAPALELSGPESLKRLEHEYSFKEELDSTWAARPLAIARHWQRTVLLLEDPGGTPLDQMLGQALGLTWSLRVAVSLANALGHLHQRGIIHKDIHPGNVLVDAATGKVWLTGFGIASRLPRERRDLEVLEIAGTFPYMAPEQTGRMNRSVDSRSDLYSCGVTFYEMLTGALPFTATDPIEWVHCHIARQPAPPTQHARDIPEVVSTIVLRLLAKTAEERYQTAAGIEADLKKCLAEWELRGRIDSFSLGTRDASDRLLLPEKLYGRDAERTALLDSFDRVVASGEPELVLISGYSGVGKSSVVNELQKAIALRRGLFISGKFDQHKRTIPYSTLEQAFQLLVDQVLGQNEEEVNRWREALLKAVGLNGQLVVNLIPEVELIIGKQPPVVELPPHEAQDRFDTVLGRFLGAFATKEHPLAFFLDDLQWIDGGTLKFLEHLVCHAGVKQFLLIGAFRTNEVIQSHPLMQAVDSIRKTDAVVREIALGPLSRDDAGRLVTDALRSERSRVEPLAELVYEKTGGNPFFINQFLTTLVEERLLEFDISTATWSWDLTHVRAKNLTDNVVDLLIGKLKRLPAATQKALQQFACLGNTAEFAMLAMAHGGSEEQMHADLWEAARGGFILRMDGSYKFLHDRVQEAAYTLIPEEKRAEVHLRIGRRLMTRLSPEKIAEQTFDIVNQLNFGLQRIFNEDEKERVAELNLRAGRKAKSSAAYGSACAYLAAAIGLVDGTVWHHRYDLAFSLWLESAECEYLNGNFGETESLIAELLSRATSKIDKAAAYRLKVLSRAAKAEYQEAVDIARECLSLFEIELPARPSQEQVQIEYEKLWQNLGDRSIESLIDLPVMIDPEIRAVMDMLSVLVAPAYCTQNNLFYLVACQMVNTSLKYGATGASSHGYAELACILGPVFHRYFDGYRFGKLACSLIEKYGFEAYKAKVYFCMERAVFWTESLRLAIEFVRLAHRAAIETHDLSYACFSYGHLITTLLMQGVHLDEVWSESQKALEFFRHAKFRDHADTLIAQQRFIQAMRGQTDAVTTFDGKPFDDEEFENRLTENRAGVICNCLTAKLQMCFLLGEYDEALRVIEKARALLWSAEINIRLVNYYFYGALTIAAVYEPVGPGRQTEQLAVFKQCLERLQEWAECCPATFTDKYTLALAEAARIENRDLDAMRLFEQAIKAAHENGFVQNEGLANELAAQFYTKLGLQKAAQSYFRDACHCYLSWGALGKVQQLDQLYPAGETQTSLRPTATIGTSIEQLDLETVMKASHAISGEIVLTKLIETLMVIVLELAGAERGLLILPDGREHRIEAEGRTSRDKVEVYFRQALVTSSELPLSLLRYVIRTQESVILADASTQNTFSDDGYLRQKSPRSVLCLPLVKQRKLVGVLYFENNLAPGVFTAGRLAMLELIASQAAISLDHARLYADLRRANVELEAEINDRKQAEERLRESEQRLEDILDNTTSVVFVKDLDLRYLLVNREYERLYQVQRDQIRGRTDLDIHPRHIAEAVRANDRKVIEAGIPIQFEEVVPSQEGERSYIAAKFLLRDGIGKPYAVCGIATDITAFKRAEELEAEMAHEREMFARQRAAELAKANDALRDCLDALSAVPNLDEFLGQVMATITGQLGAVSSTLRICDFDRKVLNLELVYQDGRVMSAAEARYPKTWRSVKLDETPSDGLEQPVTVQRILDPQTPMPDSQRSYLLGLGVKTVLVIPLVSLAQEIGRLSFRFTEDRDFRPEEFEIARALATQASLAIQLTRLAKAASQSAVLEERNRLAGEIHDSLAQSFAGVSMQLDAAQEVIKTRRSDGLNYVERANDLARFGLAEARRSALSLQPAVIEESGLIEALQMLVDRSNIPGKLRCTFHTYRVRDEKLPLPVQQDLLRIAQEAISNALRHAKPTVISVGLRSNPPNLVLEVRDNGSGFADAQLQTGEGFGFASMRARTKKLNGELEIRTAPGHGTSIFVSLPIH